VKGETLLFVPEATAIMLVEAERGRCILQTLQPDLKGPIIGRDERHTS
jgi:hypothetical protein